MAQTRPFYTDDFGTGLRVAQLVGLTSTAFFAGQYWIGLDRRAILTSSFETQLQKIKGGLLTNRRQGVHQGFLDCSSSHAGTSSTPRKGNWPNSGLSGIC